MGSLLFSYEWLKIVTTGNSCISPVIAKVISISIIHILASNVIFTLLPHARSALRSFKRHVAYANVTYDRIQLMLHIFYFLHQFMS
jgi:heme/copper-type cytochrome/quinol oxidase subunit 4